MLMLLPLMMMMMTTTTTTMRMMAMTMAMVTVSASQRFKLPKPAYVAWVWLFLQDRTIHCPITRFIMLSHTRCAFLHLNNAWYPSLKGIRPLKIISFASCGNESVHPSPLQPQYSWDLLMFRSWTSHLQVCGRSDGPRVYTVWDWGENNGYNYCGINMIVPDGPASNWLMLWNRKGFSRLYGKQTQKLGDFSGCFVARGWSPVVTNACDRM